MANFFRFNSYLKLFGLCLLSLWYPRSTNVLCCLKPCTRRVCTLNLTHFELSFPFLFFFLQSKKKLTRNRHSNHLRSLKLQAAALSRSGRRTYFTRSSIESRGITHFFQKHDLCHEITVVPSFFPKAWLGTQSPFANKLRSLFACWIVWIDCGPGCDQSFGSHRNLLLCVPQPSQSPYS